ncbi:MAG: hypothetical protein H0X30_24360 [Anaerolineae bacterium]|nr:hypothetical protein [Anaerolineae bacterium]
MTISSTTTKWGLIGRWVLAFLGFPIGGGLTYLIIGGVDDPLKGVLGGAVAGACIGGAQWLALRHSKTIDARWIAVTSAGLAAGVGLSTALFSTATDTASIVNRAAVTGIILGVVQAYMLQRKGGASIMWAITVALAYTIAWPVTRLVIKDNVQMDFVVFGSSGAILFQLITLIAVLRQPSINSSV